MPVTVRFSEHSRYDIARDAEVVMMMATTDRGSYWAEVPHEEGRGMRARRAAFKEGVVECIERGEPPCELHFEDNRVLGKPS